MLSDHSFILASFEIVSSKSNHIPLVKRRRWRSFKSDAFVADLIQSLQLVLDSPSDVNQMFDCYNDTLVVLLDKHAPLCSVSLKGRQASPWFKLVSK